MKTNRSLLITLTLLGISIIGMWGVSLEAAIPSEERRALIAFYEATDGDNWKNNSGWKEGTSEMDDYALKGTEGKWFGVTVYDNHVTKLVFTANNLMGSLPLEIGNLPRLETLVLVEDGITGELPLGIGLLKNLRQLRLITGQSGFLIPEIGQLTNLQELFLKGDFSGNLPMELGNLTKLERLHLDAQFNGDIPMQIGELSSLQFLVLLGDFNGPLPMEIGKLTKLKGMEIANLTGYIPPDLESMESLEELILSGGVEGSIPPELGKLKSLKKLILSDNKLNGSIPYDLENLENLEELDLSYNELEGDIPSELGNISKLRVLMLNNNFLTGNIPGELSNLSNLRELRLEGNQLAGDLPGALTGLKAYTINIGYNSLYTMNDTLRTFLKSKDAGWDKTQTVPPTDVKAKPMSKTSIIVSWNRIPYRSDGGGYQVYFGDSDQGPWTLAGTTSGKSVSQFLVDELRPDRTYYFKVKTYTPRHSSNPNPLTSIFSNLAEAETPSN